MKRIIILLVIAAFISTGCSKDDDIIGTLDDSTSVQLISDCSLGDISFSLDTAKSVSTDYPADGSEISLSVTDKAGIEWTLTIPGDALLKAEKITMTPMNNIESRTFPGKPESGVVFEPDRLQFLTAANLKVTKPDGKLKGLILCGDHQGSGLEFTMASSEENSVTASVRHFSTVIFDPGDDPNGKQLQNNALQQYNEAKNAARKMLKQPIEVPSPPSLPLECLGKSQYDKADAYAKTLMEPEITVLGPLGKAISSLQSMGVNIDQEGTKLAEQLAIRNMKKVDKLIKTYQPEPEKLVAVFTAASHVWTEAAYLSIKDIPKYDVFSSWAAKTRDYCLEGLRSTHNYKLVGSIFEFEKMAMFGDMGKSDLAEDIIKAMTFKLSYEVIYSADDTTINIKGEGKLKPVIQNKHNMLEGSGTAEYVSLNVTFSDSRYELEPKTFPVKMWVMNFSPCESESVDILLETLGSEDEEQVIYDEDGTRGTMKFPLINLVSCVFDKAKDPSGNYSYIFTLPLRNEQATAAVKTISKSGKEGYTMTVHLQLIHTPE